MPLYRDDPHWGRFQDFLPERLRLGPADLPREEFWEWCGHRIHLDRFPGSEEAPLRVVLLHGVGTNGRQMNLVLGSRLAARGYEVVAPDMPGYGMTEVGPRPIRYGHWVEASADLLAHLRAEAERPVVLFGLSAGGLQALHVAAIDQEVLGVVATCFLDQRLERVRLETAWSPGLARVATPLVQALAGTPLGRLRIPIRLVSKMGALVNQPEALAELLRDPSGAGAWVSLAFLESYVGYQPVLEASDFRVCPVLLTQPGEDRWTPLHLSQPVLDALGDVEVVTLAGAGHLPLEDPGLTQLEEVVVRFLEDLGEPGPGATREKP